MLNVGLLLMTRWRRSTWVIEVFSKKAVEMPEQMGLTAERLSSEGAFLLDNGVDIFGGLAELFR